MNNQEKKLEVLQEREVIVNGKTYTACGWNEEELQASGKRIRKAAAKGQKVMDASRSSRWADDLD